MFFGPLIAVKASDKVKETRLQMSEERVRLLEAENEALSRENKLLKSQSASFVDSEISSTHLEAPVTSNPKALGVLELSPVSEQAATSNLRAESLEVGASEATPGLKAVIESSDDQGAGFDPSVLRRCDEKEKQEYFSTIKLKKINLRRCQQFPFFKVNS